MGKRRSAEKQRHNHDELHCFHTGNLTAKPNRLEDYCCKQAITLAVRSMSVMTIFRQLSLGIHDFHVQPDFRPLTGGNGFVQGASSNDHSAQ